MTEKDEKLLAEFEKKMRQLMFRCDSLREENELLKKQLTEKNSEVDNLSVEVENLKSKYDNLRFVKSLSSNNTDEFMKTKDRLSKLVRDVDKCIALLKS